MTVDTRPYREALEERIGFAFEDPSEETHEFTVDKTQSVAVTLDAAAGTARILCLVDGASQGLSRALLLRLLEFNFPNDRTAGAALCATNGTSNLKLVNQFELSSIAPATLAGVAVAQGRAAIGVGKWIAEQQIARA